MEDHDLIVRHAISLHNVLVECLKDEEDDQEGINGVQYPWNPDDPCFIPNKEAVILSKGRFDYRSLGKLLKRDGFIRYMREEGHCRVHLQDFRAFLAYLEKHNLSKWTEKELDTLPLEELFDRYEVLGAIVKAEEEEIKKKKSAIKRERHPDLG